ncbi:MAG: hypothetical protein ABSH33_08060 [Steroidobacteraceae bacterium]
MNCWIDKTIKINDSWGSGATNVLRAPLGCAPEFSLRARYIRDSKSVRQLAHLQAEISSGYLSDGWHTAVFTPVGTVEVKGISGLPPWDSSQGDTYRNLIIGANNNLGDSSTQRLEGVIGYTDANGVVGYDTVRLFYAVNAVKGPKRDLVIVKIATLAAIPGTVQTRQDGAGHGPPD